jgi:hypothetical protein
MNAFSPAEQVNPNNCAKKGCLRFKAQIFTLESGTTYRYCWASWTLALLLIGVSANFHDLREWLAPSNLESS